MDRNKGIRLCVITDIRAIGQGKKTDIGLTGHDHGGTCLFEVGLQIAGNDKIDIFFQRTAYADIAVIITPRSIFFWLE